MISIKPIIESQPNPTLFKLYAPIDETYSTELINKINNVTKGCTIYQGKGMWVSGDNKLYDEDIVVIEVYYTLNESQEKSILESIYEWGLKTGQELIAMSIDNKFCTLTLEKIKGIIDG